MHLQLAVDTVKAKAGLVKCMLLLYAAIMRINNAHPISTTEFCTMTQVYNHFAAKKPTNLSVNSDLLAKAKSLKLNLSATLENALTDEVRKAERALWLKKNKDAIEASNHLAEEKGLFADSYRII